MWGSRSPHHVKGRETAPFLCQGPNGLVSSPASLNIICAEGVKRCNKERALLCAALDGNLKPSIKIMRPIEKCQASRPVLSGFASPDGCLNYRQVLNAQAVLLNRLHRIFMADADLTRGRA